jgi:hypothetical protein
MLLPGYDVGKAAQAAAYFALKSGSSINVLKLCKLLYLAEREFMARYDTPMFYESLWTRFGSYDRYALRDWAHEWRNVPEWMDPRGSAASIAEPFIARTGHLFQIAVPPVTCLNAEGFIEPQ